MLVPQGLRYSTDHEWAAGMGEGDGDVAASVRIGVTDYAQDALGDVVFVQLPEVGATYALGGSFGEVESTKSVSDIYAPVAGTVREVNPRLADEPQLVNTDPYGDGWLCVIEMDDPTQLEQLLDAEAYTALTES